MNLLIFKDIKDNSPEMQTAKNVLTQTLHLNYKKAEFNANPSDTAKTIDDLFLLCDEICKPLFHISSFNFFGSDYSNLGSTNYRDLIYCPDFWHSAIKYHCVISTLYTIRHFLLKDSTLSAYHLNTYAKQFGYFQLNKLAYLNEHHQFSTYNKENKSAYASRNFSDFQKLFKNFSSKLTPQEISILGLVSNNCFCLESSDFTYRLYRNRKTYNIIRKAYTNAASPVKSEDFINKANTFIKYFTENSDHIVDEILLLYQIERYLNLSLTTETINLMFHDPESLPLTSLSPEIICSCFNLPNVFSRKLFLNFAFDSYHNKALTENIFRKREQDSGPVYFADPPTKQSNNLILWLDIYKKFVCFFSHLVFPIYEKCFFLLYKDLTGTFNKSSIDILEQYVSEHSVDILDGGFTAEGWRDDMTDNLPTIMNSLVLNQHIFESKFSRRRCDLLLHDILCLQNNIIHPTVFPDFNEAYFGCVPGTNYHRKLMTFYVNSTLNTY